MHLTCMKWFEYCREKYPKYFNDCSVLEMGCININGTVRHYFKDCDYVGLDWRPGPGVDVVSLAHEVRFDKKFKTIVSASMLEHDPYWEMSLANMVDLLADDGGLFLSWGGIDNLPHCNETAPDGGFHPLKASLVFDYLISKGLNVQEFGGEDSFMKHLGLEDLDLRIAIHGICLIGFKGEEYIKEEQVILEVSESNR